MVNHRANEVWKTHSGRFGFVDFIDDEAVSKALFTAAEDWVKAKGMHSIHGPLGFTDLDQEGMLVEGFDQLGTMATIYNHPYYPQHVGKLGYVKDAEWVEYQITIPDVVPERMRRISGAGAEEAQAAHPEVRQLLEAASRMATAQKLFELVNESYSHLYGFTPLTQAQIDYYLKLYIPMLKLEYLVLMVNEAGDLVGMGVAMPSLSRALQKAQGKLFPFGVAAPAQGAEDEEPADRLPADRGAQGLPEQGRERAGLLRHALPHLQRNGAIDAPKAIPSSPPTCACSRSGDEASSM